MNSFLDICNVSSNAMVSVTYIMSLIAIVLINVFVWPSILKIPLFIMYIAILLQFYLPAKLDSNYLEDNKVKLKYSLYTLSILMIVLNITLYSSTTGEFKQFSMNILLQSVPALMGLSLEPFIKLPELDVQVSLKK